MQGTGACAGSCDDLKVTEEQITIGNRDHDPTEILGETERPLSFKSQESPPGDRRRKCDERSDLKCDAIVASPLLVMPLESSFAETRLLGGRMVHREAC
jgi:hypothetical protein